VREELFAPGFARGYSNIAGSPAKLDDEASCPNNIISN
jgi:hypothetical protein